MWTNSVQLWGCASKSNIQFIQRFENRVLTEMVDAPWYLRNNNVYRDLEMDTVSQTVSKFAKSHDQRLKIM